MSLCNTNDITDHITKVKKQLMAEDNYYLTIQMAATVKLKGNAVSAGVDTNLRNHPESTIYQTFLMTYDKLETVNSQSMLGIDPDADASFGKDKYYYIKAGDDYQILETELKKEGEILYNSDSILIVIEIL